MKRSKLALAILAMVAAGGLFACERQDPNAYNPSVDSLLPQNRTVDMSILENQKKLYDEMRARAGPVSKPATPTPAPAPAPTSAPTALPAPEAPSTPPATTPATPAAPAEPLPAAPPA